MRKVAFDEIQDAFPANAGRVNADERVEQVLMRHRHVQRRYRQY